MVIDTTTQGIAMEIITDMTMLTITATDIATLTADTLVDTLILMVVILMVVILMAVVLMAVVLMGDILATVLTATAMVVHSHLEASQVSLETMTIQLRAEPCRPAPIVLDLQVNQTSVRLKSNSNLTATTELEATEAIHTFTTMAHLSIEETALLDLHHSATTTTLNTGRVADMPNLSNSLNLAEMVSAIISRPELKHTATEGSARDLVVSTTQVFMTCRLTDDDESLTRTSCPVLFATREVPSWHGHGNSLGENVLVKSLEFLGRQLESERSVSSVLFLGQKLSKKDELEGKRTDEKCKLNMSEI
ncbi:hypothetical protein LTS08_003380 [Lithohypha guttulata]|nr:hypothetical protein LTS08_003380 [Lithohypha guttulata]